MDTEGDTIVDSVSETPGAQEVIHNTSTDENNDDWGDEISDTGIAFSVSYEAEDARIGRKCFVDLDRTKSFIIYRSNMSDGRSTSTKLGLDS